MVPEQPRGPVQLQHSLGHIDCPACNATRDRVLAPAAFGRLTFAQAAPTWLAEHAIEISPKTHDDYKYYLRNLTRFFGELQLRDIHIGHIQEYQKWRAQAHAEFKMRGAGPSCINHEMNTLAQILGRCGLWTEIEKLYKPLRLPKEKIGKALEEGEEERLFKVAMMSPRWKVAYWASLVMAHTTADASEIRHLHCNEVDLYRQEMSVREGTKNNYRIRKVPLNTPAAWAMRQIVERYYKECRRHHIQADEAEHYVLFQRAPAGVGRRTAPPQFDKPQGSWKKAWYAIRKKAGLPKFRIKDLRHHAITQILENPEVSEQTAMKIAGHVSHRMLDNYSHVRMAAKREAVRALEKNHPKPVDADAENQVEIPRSLKYRQ